MRHKRVQRNDPKHHNCEGKQESRSRSLVLPWDMIRSMRWEVCNSYQEDPSATDQPHTRSACALLQGDSCARRGYGGEPQRAGRSLLSPGIGAPEIPQVPGQAFTSPPRAEESPSLMPIHCLESSTGIHTGTHCRRNHRCQGQRRGGGLGCHPLEASEGVPAAAQSSVLVLRCIYKTS